MLYSLGKNHQWSDEEIYEAFRLAQIPENRDYTRSKLGRPNVEKVARLLNDKYHVEELLNGNKVRTGSNVRNMFNAKRAVIRDLSTID